MYHVPGRVPLPITAPVLPQLVSWREAFYQNTPSLETSQLPPTSLAYASTELMENGWVNPFLPFFHTRPKVHRGIEVSWPVPGHPCTYCVWGTSAGICGTSQERERHICLSAPGSSASFVPSTFAGPRAAATSQPPPALWPAPSAFILPSDSLPLSALPDRGLGGGR